METSNPLLQVKNGCFGYRENELILKDINFELGRQDVLTILGPNGIGKTTLIKCMTGILPWGSGETLIEGAVIDHQQSGTEQCPIAFVPQAHPLSFPYSIYDIVLMGRARHIGMFSTPSKKDREIADWAMEVVGIQDFKERSCTQLSGGQLQLAFIARALAGQPRILVLDEPESHLDFKNQFKILQLIEELVQKQGLSCIMNTHYPEHALRISHHSLMLGKGKYLYGETKGILQENNVREFFGVESKIISVDYKNNKISSFVVLDVK